MTTLTSPSSPALASRVARLVAQWLDSLVALAIVCAFALPLAVSYNFGAFSLWLGIVAAVAYVLLSDGFRGGQSYGKRLLHIAVVDTSSGVPCSFGQSFLRNMLLLVLGFIDWVFIFGGRRERLGDKLAGTKVIALR
jgi:uncharacterized RDD family membrane protein YckC